MTLTLLKWLERARLLRGLPKPMGHSCTIMGLTFPNRVGLAAGLDKNGDYIDGLAVLGFGHIEIGTVTPKPQPGNPKPRLFRFPEQEAIINRMGFNNKGVHYLVTQLQQIRYQGILGINIGKNKETPIEKAIDDYVYCMRQVLPYASYITINISSPNTEQLRSLQQDELLRPLLRTLKQEQAQYYKQSQKYIPVVVKVAPDLTKEQLVAMADIFLQEKIDGIIATNSTLSRVGMENVEHADEVGGLSGKPLLAPSTAIIAMLHQQLNGAIPIIASGGIMDESDAQAKINAGASLVQVYSGFIYHGPDLVRRIGSF